MRRTLNTIQNTKVSSGLLRPHPLQTKQKANNKNITIHQRFGGGGVHRRQSAVVIRAKLVVVLIVCMVLIGGWVQVDDGAVPFRSLGKMTPTLSMAAIVKRTYL